jgi:hypothetical protein
VVLKSIAGAQVAHWAVVPNAHGCQKEAPSPVFCPRPAERIVAFGVGVHAVPDSACIQDEPAAGAGAVLSQLPPRADGLSVVCSIPLNGPSPASHPTPPNPSPPLPLPLPLSQVREEQTRLRRDLDAPITGDLLNEMTFTRQVVKEILRYRPPAPMVPQVSLEGGGQGEGKEREREDIIQTEKHGNSGRGGGVMRREAEAGGRGGEEADFVERF